MRQLVYLAGFQLDGGESISHAVPDAGVAPTRLADAMRVSDDGTQVGIDGELARDLLFGHVDGAEVETVVARLQPVARGLFGACPDPIAWHSVHSTYALCAEDRAVAPDLQRAMARRASTTLEWPSDHSPMLSHPDLVASLLVSVARSDG